MGRVTPLLTSRRVLNITYKTPLETLLSVPETLPTSEPVTPQIGYTVATIHLPTFDIPPYRKIWIACLYGAGYFPSAGVLYWRMKKNGVSVASGTASVPAGYYYTVNAFFYDVAVGDLLELALWSSVTDSNWDYKAYQVQVTRVILFNKPRLLFPCNFAVLSAQPFLSLGTPHVTVTVALYPCNDDKALTGITSGTVFTSLYVGDIYGIFRIGYGDYSTSNTAVVSTSPSYRPYYYRNYAPTQIIMRGLKTEGQL